MTSANLPWSIRVNADGPTCQMLDREGNTIAVFTDFRNAELALSEFAELARLKEELETTEANLDEAYKDLEKANAEVDRLELRVDELEEVNRNKP